MKSGRHHHVEQKWAYTYPKVQGKVQNPAVTKFQTGLINLKEANTGRVLHDYTRYQGYTLNGVAFFKTEIDEAGLCKEFEELARTASGYNEADRTMLVDFLRTRGGQDSNFIIQELIRDNHFIDDPFKGDSSTSQNVLDSNWDINKDGKIELTYCTDILSIEVKTPDVDGEIVSLIADDQKTISSHRMGENEFLIRKKNGLMPLMRIEFKMVLEIQDGMVVPTISNLQITGFNKVLHVNEEKFTDKRDRRASIADNLLGKINANIMSFEDDPAIQKQFMLLRDLIIKSNYGENMGLVKLASQYLERINCSIKGFLAFKAEQMSAIRLLSKDEVFTNACSAWFGKKFFSTLTNEDILEKLAEQGISGIGHISNKEFDKDDICNAFGATYHDMQILLHYHQPIYACNAADSTICHDWVNEVEKYDPQENACYKDFRQGYQINNVDINPKTNDRSIKYAIDDLTKLVTTQNDEQRRQLSTWIAKKGGQPCDRLVELFINSGEIAIDLPKQLQNRDEKLHFKPHFGNPVHTWGQAIDGSLELTSVYYVTSLFCEAEKISAIKNISDNQIMFIETNKELADGKKAPLMRVETKISLSIEDGKVVPKVKALNVESYSRNLTPARLGQEQTHRVNL